MEGNRPRSETAGVNNIVTGSGRDINGTWTEEAEFPQTVNGAWGSLGVPLKKRSGVCNTLSPNVYINSSAKAVLLPRGVGMTDPRNQEVRKLLINMSIKKLS